MTKVLTNFKRGQLGKKESCIGSVEDLGCIGSEGGPDSTAPGVVGRPARHG